MDPDIAEADKPVPYAPLPVPLAMRRLITTTVPLEDAASAFDRSGEDVKVVITREGGVA